MPKAYMPFIAGSLLGLALASGGFLLVNQAQAQQRALGPYMIMHHSNPTASAGVFRINESTGYVSYCFIDVNGRPAVNCTPEVP